MPLTQSKSIEQFDRVDLTALVSEVAMTLMSASLHSNVTLSQLVLAKLSHFFDVHVAFYRRHDIENRLSILVAEYPVREFIPDPDPLAVFSFDENPMFSFTEHLAESALITPRTPNTEKFHDMVAQFTGVKEVTVLAVPLRSGPTTDGVLGLVRLGDNTFDDSELHALKCIATLLYQVQSRVGAERALRATAYKDLESGLKNRSALVANINDCVTKKTPICCLRFELMDLKTVNDTLGRKIGDKMIVQFAQDLQHASECPELCFRVAGNGFVIILEDNSSTVELQKKLDHILDQLSIEIRIGDRIIKRLMRAGAAHTLDRAIDAEELLAEVDRALVNSNQRDSLQVTLYNQELALAQQNELAFEIEFKEAIATKSQVFAYFQPEVDLETGQMVGYEALARWQHPSRGLLPAGVFIEMAERSGLVVELSRQIMEASIAQQAQWLQADPSLNTTMRVNVSPAQLIGTDLYSEVEQLLQQYAVQASSICIEVTEHAVMDYTEEALDVLKRLSDLGVKIAIDDFGIGHSSLAKLKYLPADTLKIDRAFIMSLVDSARDRSLVDTIVRMAKAFDMSVVAEGVETEEELTELLLLGADFAQGYFFGRPMSAEAISQLFHTQLFNPAEYHQQRNQACQ